MNCCDYDCNQGRNCPARVARVGQKMPAAEPLPESVWRYWLKRLVYVVLAGLLASITIALNLWAMR